MSIEDFYTSTAVVQKVTSSRTAMGGNKKTYSTRIASLPCRFNFRRISEIDQYGKMNVTEVGRIYCAATSTTATIVESDRINIGTRTFEVTGIANVSFQDHHLQIDVVEVK